MALKEALAKKRFVVTTEMHTADDEDPGALVKNLELVRGRIDSIAVPETEIEGVLGNKIQTCQVLKQNRFEPIYQTTTREKNRLQIQKDLIDAHVAGVENLLVFTEDYRITGDSLQEIMFFHVDMGKLTSVLTEVREGHTVDDRPLNFKAEFFLGSGIESRWGKDVPALELKEMEAMTEIGTGYFLTTPIFDLQLFEKFMKKVNTFGVPVIAEVMIVRTAGMAQFLNRHLKSGLVPDHIITRLMRSPDKRKASIEIFAETVNGLRDLCQGIHIISIGGEEKLRHYLDEAKLF